MGKYACCSNYPSGELLKAFGEFNRSEWYECHETLEELWDGSEGEIRRFYQGILQIAVSLLHWRNSNFGGATSLLASGINYLRRVSPVCQRIEVASLVMEAEAFAHDLDRLGPDLMARVDEHLIPRLRLTPA
jgi:hypothetical protein